MKSFSKRMSRLGTENAFSVIGKAKKFEEEVLKPQGKHLIYLQIGEPGFDTPENINHAAISAIKNNKTHYTPTPGIAELRKAVAEKTKRITGIPYKEKDVIITSGAKPIIFYTLNTLIDPGDEIIIPTPAFPIYQSVAEYLGGKVISLPVLEKNNFDLDIKELKKVVNKKTKIIVLNTPHNPTGGVFSKKTIKAIAEIAKKNDIWVLSDEIYNEIIHEGKHFSIASISGMSERTIILNGVSKTYAMTGYRIGWGVTKNKEMFSALERFATNDTSCPPAINQYAALEAITGPQEPVKKMIKEYRKRRDLMVKLVNQIEGMKCKTPKGAFYLMVNVRGLIDRLKIKTPELCDRIMKEAHVLILPGSVFGDYADDYVRFSYVSTEEKIIEGLARVKKFVESL